MNQTRFWVPWVGFLVAAVALGGCASMGSVGGGKSASTTPGAMVELEGTRWKQPTFDGKIDGRVIEFKRSSDGRYRGALVDLGKQLHGQVGAYVGAVVFELWPTPNANEYNGLYRRINESPVESTFSVSPDGNELKCSEEESLWVRAS